MMEPLKSVKLLDDNKTLQPYAVQPVYAKDTPPGAFGGGNFVRNLPPLPSALTARVKRDMLYARDLCIIHGPDERYWKWKRLQQMPMLEVAELKNVCWLEVTGKYDLENLADGMYEFTFVIKIEENLWFDSRLAKFTITIPDKKGDGVEKYEIVKHVNIMALKGQTDSLIHVKLGDIKCTGDGEVNFSLIDLSPVWKRGLTVVGVYINPS